MLFGRFANGRRVVALIGVVASLSMAVLVAVNPTNASAAGTATVRLINKTFDQPALTVTAGTKVTWINEDNVAHTVTSGTRETPDGAFDARLDDGGSTFSFTFNTPGTFNYFCKPHANMNAKIIVTAASGSAAAANGAAGTTQITAGAANSTTASSTPAAPAQSSATSTSEVVPFTPALVTGSASGGTEPRPEDVALVQGVRRADLWESVAGQQAITKASDPRVADIGNHIQSEHTELDLVVRDIGERLNINLPTLPNADQQGWLTELNNAEGRQFDQIFVARLRFAHGGVFQQIAEVRANTPNDEIRAFAIQANTIVSRHLLYLESTGLADFSNIRNPQDAKANNANSLLKGDGTLKAKAASSSSPAGGGDSGTIVLILAIGFILLLLLAFLFRGTMT